MKRLPTRLDRYPAKMVSHLADKLVFKYAKDCTRLFDPFCGSGAVLAAGRSKNLSVVGLDINPYAVLLSEVKLRGFDAKIAKDLCTEFLIRAQSSQRSLPVNWDAKDYWFSAGTINKYERLRRAALTLDLNQTPEGRAVLLAYTLSVRLCSRADQRSPKPFISKTAVKNRKGKHYDPFQYIPKLLIELTELYGHRVKGYIKLMCLNLTSASLSTGKVGRCSHIITSPPYINAQDYFRNSKLELYMLEDLLPFTIGSLRDQFIGTERGEITNCVSAEDAKYHKYLVPHLKVMENTHPRQAGVVHKYIKDMGKSFDAIKSVLSKSGIVVIVCGDNLVGGYPIKTWHVLNRLLQNRGFVLFDRFGDDIHNRHVPPKRNGHKGLIKQEVISAFRVE
jgi:hypothetical protein